MIEPSSSDAIRHQGLALEADVNDLVGNPPLEKLTTDKKQKGIKKPRRFSYQSGCTILDGYTIKRGIGIGGFGEVYFAISDAGKEVALKRIQRNLDVELRGVSQCLNLKHVNLIALWDIRQDTEGESWVVMEYVPGESLRDVLERNPNGVPVEDAQRWFTQILDGVSYLHDHGIVHRDLKPGNIFYDQDAKVVKIGDYGLSKFISTSKRDGQTESVGTFHYMAPEIGKGTYGKEIDIYSLGIILCEVLSGQVPFDGESGQEIIMKHLTATPTIDFVDPRFHSAILKALSKDPSERFTSVKQMTESIDWDGTRRIVISDSGQRPNGADEIKTAKSVVEPMFVSEKNASPADRITTSRTDEPMYIGDDEIQLGEVQQYSEPGDHSPVKQASDADNWSVSKDGSMRMSNVKDSVPGGRMVVADHAVGVAQNNNVITSRHNRQTEPVAAAFGNGYEKVSQWWNGIGATPLKVALVILLSLFVLFNAEWLVPLSIGLGCAYMVYFLIRSRIAQRKEENQPKSNSTTIRPFSKRECLRLIEEKLRETRLSLPFAEKLAEALGSVLTATFVVGVSTLVALGFSGFDLNGSVATLSVFTWLTLTTLIAVSVCVFLTKVFESRIGNHWKRRFVTMTCGMLIGVLSFAIYHCFLIDSVIFPERISALENLVWMTQGETGLMRFITFFAVFFLVIRWWKAGDALRTSQFSIFVVGLHATLAVGLALATSFPVIWGLIIGGTLSVAVQLASTWIKTGEREKIQYEVMQSISA